MAEDYWQTVGKDGKTARKDPAKKRKRAQGFQPSVLEPADPVPEDDTGFSSLNVSRGKKRTSEQQSSAATVKHSQKQSKGKKQDPKGHRRSSHYLTDALNELDGVQIKDCFCLAQARYSEQSSILRDLAQFLKSHLTPDEEPAMKEVTPLFLAENIPKSVSDALRWCYEKCQPESLDTFYASCVDALETEAHKGGYPETYQILILTLQSFRPAVIEVPKSQLKAMLQSCISRPREVLCLLKAALPFPECDNVHMLTQGFELYCHLVIPYLLEPNNVPKEVLIFSYNYLLNLCKSLLVFGDQGLVKELPVFKRLIDFIVAQLPKQLANHKKSLTDPTYDIVIQLCVELTHPIPLSSLFRLGFMKVGDKHDYEEEKRLLSFLVACVLKCELCRDEWKSIFSDHLKLSGILLIEMKTVKSSRRLRGIQSMLEQFYQNIEELQGEDQPNVDLCADSLNYLLKRCQFEEDSDTDDEFRDRPSRDKKKGNRTTWSSLVTWVMVKMVILVLFIILVDICWHQGWANCQNCKMLLRLGVDVPPISLQPINVFISRKMAEVGMSDSWIAMWDTLVVYGTLLFEKIRSVLYLSARMYFYLYVISKDAILGYLQRFTLLDYLNHFLPFQ